MPTEDAGHLLATYPEQLATLMAHMMESADQLPGIIDSSIGSDLAELARELQGVVGGELADRIAEQAKRLDLKSLA